MKRALLVLLLAATIAVPFLLRPGKPGLAPAGATLVIITPHNEAIRHEFGLGFQQWYKSQTGRTVVVDWRVIGGTVGDDDGRERDERSMVAAPWW